MAFHLHVLNLRGTATSKDIRKLFSGLEIEDDGVTLVGGPKGEAFVTFSNQTDLLRAMQKDGTQYLELNIADTVDKLEAINRMCMAKLQKIGKEDTVNSQGTGKSEYSNRDQRTTGMTNDMSSRGRDSYDIQVSAKRKLGRERDVEPMTVQSGYTRQDQPTGSTRMVNETYNRGLASLDIQDSANIRLLGRDSDVEPRAIQSGYAPRDQHIAGMTTETHNRGPESYNLQDSDNRMLGRERDVDFRTVQTGYTHHDQHSTGMAKETRHSSPGSYNIQDSDNRKLGGLDVDFRTVQTEYSHRDQHITGMAKENPQRGPTFYDLQESDNRKLCELDVDFRTVQTGYSHDQHSTGMAKETHHRGPESYDSQGYDNRILGRQSDVDPMTLQCGYTRHDRDTGMATERHLMSPDSYDIDDRRSRRPRNSGRSNSQANANIHSKRSQDSLMEEDMVLVSGSSDMEICSHSSDMELASDSPDSPEMKRRKPDGEPDAQSWYNPKELKPRFSNVNMSDAPGYMVPKQMEPAPHGQDYVVPNQKPPSFSQILQLFSKKEQAHPNPNSSHSHIPQLPYEAPYEAPAHPRPDFLPSSRPLDMAPSHPRPGYVDSDTSKPAFYSGLEKAGPMPTRSPLSESLFKSLSPEGRAPRYSIAVSTLPPNVTARMVYKWVGGERGTARGVILLNPTNDRPIAFVIYDDEAERDKSLQRCTRVAEPFSDADTFRFIAKFISSWFKWKGDNRLRSPIHETTSYGVDNDIGFMEMRACEELLLCTATPIENMPPTPVVNMPPKPLMGVAVKKPVSLKGSPDDNETNKSNMRPLDWSLFKSLSAVGRKPHYNMFVSDLPANVTASMVYKSVGARKGKAHGVILLRPTNGCSVAFIIFDNEAERDKSLRETEDIMDKTAASFSDADTLNFINNFIIEWFKSRGPAEVNSPITETKAYGSCDNYVSFAVMRSTAGLPEGKSVKPCTDKIPHTAEEPNICPPQNAVGETKKKTKQARRRERERQRQKDPEGACGPQSTAPAWRKAYKFNLMKASTMCYIELKTFDKTYSANEIWSWFPESEGVITAVESTGKAIGAVIAFKDSICRYDANDKASVMNAETPRWTFQKPVTSRQAKAFLAVTAVTNFQIRFSTTSGEDRVISREEASILVDLRCRSNVESMIRYAPPQGEESFIHRLKNPDVFWQHDQLILALYNLDRESTACEILSSNPGGVCAAKLDFHDHGSNTMAYVFFKDKESREMAKVMSNCGKNRGAFAAFNREPLELLLAQSCHTCTVSESSLSGVDRIVAMKEFELALTNAPFKLTDTPLHYLRLDEFNEKYSASQLWFLRGERQGSVKGVILVSREVDNAASVAFLALNNLQECRSQARKIIFSKHLNKWKGHLVSRSEVFRFLNETSADHTIKVSSETGQDRFIDPEELSHIRKKATKGSVNYNNKYFVFVVNGLSDVESACEVSSMYNDDGYPDRRVTLIRCPGDIGNYAFIMFNELEQREIALSKPGVLRCTEEGMLAHLASFGSDCAILKSSETGKDRVLQDAKLETPVVIDIS